MERKLFSHPSWILILTISLIISKGGKATLDIKPTDTVVLVNSSTFFNCSTFNSSNSSKDIVWYHYSVGKKERIDVFDDGEIRPNYKNRFRVETDWSKGIANLIIQDATLEDAGVYECQDGNGFGEEASAQLIVLEAVPTCKSNIHPDGVIGPNDCGIPPDQVQMSCSIVYRGNIPVQLDWRNRLENDNSSLIFECSNTANGMKCNLTVTGDYIRNNSVYICQTKNTGKNTLSCSTNAIRILDAMNDNKTISKTDEDEFICSANSSQQCSYTWESDDGTIVFTSKSMKPTRSGQYSCKANCTLRGQTCRVRAGISIVTIDTKTEEPSKTLIIAGVVISVFVIAAVAAAIICYLLRQQICKKCMKNDSKACDEHGEDNALHILVNKNESALKVKTAAHSQDVDSSMDMIDFKLPVEDSIHKVCRMEAPLIDKGSSGEIYGPVQYEGKQCVRQRIVSPKNDQNQLKGLKWKQLDHDNLIKFYEVVPEPPTLYIIMEYAAGGSVRKALNGLQERNAKDLPFETVRDWATQIAHGMNFLHVNGIIHKGLKCAQILIMEPFDPSTFPQVTLKVASYSLANEIHTSNEVTFKGMFQWMPPEAFQVSKEPKLSKNSDIWSYAVTVWEILTQEIPHKGLSIHQIEETIASGMLPLKIPDSCPLKKIMEECFNHIPAARPSFGDILTSLKGLPV